MSTPSFFRFFSASGRSSCPPRMRTSQVDLNTRSGVMPVNFLSLLLTLCITRLKFKGKAHQIITLRFAANNVAMVEPDRLLGCIQNRYFHDFFGVEMREKL